MQRCSIHILFCCSSAFLFVASVCSAQSSYRFRHYTALDGLASDNALGIVQDSVGFIWIRYTGAITRFDGNTFKVYKYDADDSIGSPGSAWIDRVQTDK